MPDAAPAGPTLSFIITALNEEAHLEATVAMVREAVTGLASGYEMILVNDGSSDSTGAVMDRLAVEDARLRVIHNPVNRGLGAAYKRGLREARMEYVLWVSGDDAETAPNLRNILTHVGSADIVIPYLLNQHNRPLFRRFTSWGFVLAVNLLCGVWIRYYNGSVVHRRALVQGIDIVTDSFAYQAEALIKLLRAGHSYVEVGYQSRRYSGVFSNALKPRNLVSVIAAVARLFWWSRFGNGRRA